MTARMRDVAQRAGVSVKTVSNVINHYPHVTSATRARVEAAIAELDYRPHLGARSLRKGRCSVIALAIPDLAQVSFAGLAAAVGRAARKRGVAVLIEQTEGDAVAEGLALEGLRDRLVDGILLWPTASAGTAAPTRPVVLLGKGHSDLPFDRVSLENAHSPIALSTSHKRSPTPRSPATTSSWPRFPATTRGWPRRRWACSSTVWPGLVRLDGATL